MSGPTVKGPAERTERARRAFELSLNGHPYQAISTKMKAEGYRKISAATVGVLIREYASAAILPLAKEHVTREFERLLAQRTRIETNIGRCEEIYNAEHVAHSNGRVIKLEDDEGKEQVVRDNGPRVQALTALRGFEELLLKNTEAMARLFGYNATVRTEVSVITETDRAIHDLIGEMNARDDIAPADVGG